MFRWLFDPKNTQIYKHLSRCSGGQHESTSNIKEEGANSEQHKGSAALSTAASFLSSYSSKKQIFTTVAHSHNGVSLSCICTSSTLICHDTSTYYSISPSSRESNIMQPHYLWLIVKRHLCILMGNA